MRTITAQSNQIVSRTFKTNAPVKRGRKPYTTPDVIDLTGRTHFMVVRKLQTNKKQKKKINSNECKNCELNDEYVDILEKRINTLEGLVNKLDEKTINMPEKNSVAISNELNSYSDLDINSLLRISDTIGQILSNKTRRIPPATAIETIEAEYDENIIPEFWNTNIDGQNMF
jgi:hypothetical protein